MTITSYQKKDLLRREQTESLQEFTQQVETYLSNSDMSLDEFVKSVVLVNLSLDEVARFYADLYKTHLKANILCFFSDGRRTPLFSQRR